MKVPMLIFVCTLIALANLGCSPSSEQSGHTSHDHQNMNKAISDQSPDTPVVPVSSELPSDMTTEEKHPIDLALDECMSANPSNLGIRQCLVEANEKWDQELNRLYKALMNMCGEADGAKLKAAQRAWLKYRDLEYAFIEAQFEGMEGSMYPNIIITEKMAVLRHRVLELTTYHAIYQTRE